MAQQSGDEVTPFGPADAIMPKDMARHAERSGADKAEQDAFSLFALAMLAGAYVAFGATFAAAVTAGFDGAVPAGFANLVGGLAFTLAYVLAIVGGAELFTTNVLMMMAWAHGRLPTFWLLRAWSLVFAGNFLGAATTALLLIGAGQHAEADGAVAASLLASAARIDGLTVTQALLLGLLGNTLLCLGVWLTNSARTTTDRILALTPPVAAFYALGLEHAVALIFYLPSALWLGLLAEPDFWAGIGGQPLDLTAAGFTRALASITLGNILGGGGLVALTYWFVYLRPARR